MRLAHAVRVNHESDIADACRRVRHTAQGCGFGHIDVERLVTAVSELARNQFNYATDGEIRIYLNQATNRQGVTIEALDAGPGIVDLAAALKEGYTTGKGLGLGLPAVRSAVDEFHIESQVGCGTLVRITRWCPRQATWWIHG